MRLNEDFSLNVVIRPDDYHWVPSPMPGVHRMMLDRIGHEVARATTIVHYAANSEFSAHVHGGGEEYFVLDGIFSDEYGDYPEGTYVRNPIGTAHTPRVGPEGATIFVKLHQFAVDDSEQKVIHTREGLWREDDRSGLALMALHTHRKEHITLVKSPPNHPLVIQGSDHGEEILVLDGDILDENGEYAKGSWLRSPQVNSRRLLAGGGGAIVYVKTGHL
jgi:anti-sigma factor ChrR (cupin superfamily)